MRWKPLYKQWCLASLLCFLVLHIPLQAAAMGLHQTAAKAVVFLLDASNSMNGNDRNRIAMDSIAQLAYSLPSNYAVGFAAYNTDVVSAVGMTDSSGRDLVVEAANSVRYTGYTNAGAGLERAMELLSTSQAAEKTVVMFSDGEIIMGSDEATAESSSQFQSAVSQAEEQGIRIHVIGLGPNTENNANTIFHASVQTGGVNYHAPRAEGIQRALDDILLDQLGVKKTTAAVVDGDGGMEELDITIPSANASSAKILFISDSSIRNLNAGFNAGNARQVSGAHYTMLELPRPTDERIHVTFQGEAGSQVKVDVITEYHVAVIPHVTYADTEPEEEDATHYDRIAQVTLAFCDAENPERRVLTDSAFQGLSSPVTVDNVAIPASLEHGTISFQIPVVESGNQSISIDLSGLDTNLALAQPVSLSLEGAPALPKVDARPQIIIVTLGILALISIVAILLASRPRKVTPLQNTRPVQPSMASRYHFSGRLNLYITNTWSGREFPPLTYNLFRIPDGKKLSLQEVLERCEVDEPFEGADKIFFQPAAGHCLLLTNESDCTLIQRREILMKGHSYQIGPNSKVDITFEDERSELALQYRDVRPSDMRLLAGEPR